MGTWTDFSVSGVEMLVLKHLREDDCSDVLI